jgi:hypothetical protein
VAAGATYLAGARVAQARPVKGSSLALLALAALAATQASAKAHSTAARLDDLINGNLRITLPGLTLTANLDMGGHNINGLDMINSDGTDWATNGGLSFTGTPTNHGIWLHGNEAWSQGGHWNNT